MKSFLCAVTKTALLITLIISGNHLFAQNWQAKYETPKVFIENKGQFDALNQTPGKEIIYGSNYGDAQFLFTKTGLTYRLCKKEYADKEKVRERMREELKESKKGKVQQHKEEEKEENKIHAETETVNMQWLNANPDAEVVAADAVENYFNFGMGNGSINYLKGYKKITYKNLYADIDVEYVFHPVSGIEYSFVLRPGADVSQIKMNYTGAGKLGLDAKKNLHIKTALGDIIDHAPQSFYANNSNEKIASAFVCSNNTVSFQLSNYDHNQTVTIDPWTQTPSFNTQWDCVWECEKDATGNAYVIGGVMPMQVLKYNSTGTLQWTYSTPYDTSNCWLGTIATDNAGNSYITRGSISGIQKLSTAGTLTWNNNGGGGSIGNSDEYWSIAFNCDQTKLVVGGTSGAFALPPKLVATIFDINTSNGNIISSKVVAEGAVISFPPKVQEVRAITACGNGKYYFLTQDTIGYLSQDFSSCGGNAGFYKNTNSYAMGYKCEDFRVNNTGIAAMKYYGGYVFTCKGTQLDKRNFATGAIIGSVAIPSGAYTTTFGVGQVGNSGIDIDNCGNIYVGSQNQVVKFDQNLTQLATYATAFNVYDVQVTTNGDIIACGSTYNSTSNNPRQGYIQSIATGACAPYAPICCDATVCNAGPVCSTAPAFNLTASSTGGVWSGIGITNPSTGAFSPAVAGPGIHYVTNTLACGSDSVAITVNNCTALVPCQQTNGDITVTGGSGVYTWAQQVQQQDCSGCIIPLICFPTGCAVTVNAWQNFATGSTVTPPGTYPLRVTDEYGTTATITSLASLPSCTSCTLAANATPSNTTCGNNNGSVTATPNGGTATYVWSNGLTTQTISNLAAGNYTVTVTGSGCSVTASATVGASSGVTATTSTTNAGCSPTGSATATVSTGTGPFNYAWSSGANTQTASNLAAGNYTVTITGSGNCTATASATVGSSGSGVSITTSATNAGCSPTGSATATVTAGTGPFTYSWSSGANTQTAANLSAGNYTVTVTGSGNCSATASITVGSSGSGVVLSPSSANATCGNNNGTASITVTAGTGPYIYLWSNGGVTSSILNVAGGTYTVTVTGSGNCTATASVIVNTTNGVNLNTTSNNAGCTTAGSATVNTTSGTGPFGYLWSNGATTQTAINLSAGTYTVTVTGSGNCTATASVTITSSGGITLTSSSTNTTCGNNNGSASVTASGGTGTYTYNWGGGLTTPSLSNLPAGTYTVTVSDNAGCTSTASAIVNPSGTGSVHITSARPIMCAGDSIQICTDNTYASYLWNHGQTTQCIHATQAGNYYVTVTDNGNCTASSNHLPIQVYPLPPVSISVNGDTMTAYNAVTYQWFYNGTLIPGATNHIYIATQAGNYTLAISDTNGCVAVSNPVTIGTVGITQIVEGEQLKVYPNPLESGYWTLETGNNLLGSSVEIFDDNGRLVYKSEIKNLKSQIELNAASGIYLMKISGTRHPLALKLIKL